VVPETFWRVRLDCLQGLCAIGEIKKTLILIFFKKKYFYETPNEINAKGF